MHRSHFSQQGRPLEVLTVSCDDGIYCMSNNQDETADRADRKKIIIVSARSHPAETASSLVCQGKIRLSANVVSRDARQGLPSRSHAFNCFSNKSIRCSATGLIDFLVSNHPAAECLRCHTTFKIVPMLNPDGVFAGNTQ